MAHSFKLPAIKGIIGDWVYYQTSIPFSIVGRFIDNDHSIREYPTLDDHLQRELSSRSKKIAEYLLREDSRFFNSVIVGIYGDSPSWYNFDFQPSSVPSMELEDDVLNSIGILVFDGSERLFSIDGQHRIDGIKQALRQNQDQRFVNDELAVIFVAHDDSRQGKIRTRRLFSEINTKAVKVTGLDNLITNEDEPEKINARKVYADFTPFEKDVFIALNKTANIDSEADEFTTILNLEQVNKELYNRIYTHPGYRPSSDILSDLYELSIRFWSELIDNILEIQQVLNNNQPISNYRNTEGGHFLFRPIGLKHCAEMYSMWISNVDEDDLDTFWQRVNNIDSRLNGIYWKDVLWDNAKQVMKKVSPKLVRNYFSYLLGMDYDNNYTYIQYNKQIGKEVEEDYIALPQCPN